MLVLTSPTEICFKILNFPVYFYGIIMACACLIGVFASLMVQKKYYTELPKDFLFDLTPLLIFWGLISARLYYCILNYHYYSNHLSEIFFLRQGGLSIHGGIFGGILTLLIYAKIKRLPILKVLDICTYGLLVGQIIGRWGNFFNMEAFGSPTTLPVKLFIPLYKRPLEYINYEYFHPTFLYESLLNILVFFILFFIVRKFTKNYTGMIFGYYLILYSIVRFFTENIRIDSVFNICKIPIAQIIAVITIICAVIYLSILYTKQKRN